MPLEICIQCKALKAIYDSRGIHASTSATSDGHAYVVVKAHGQLLSMLLFKVLMVLCFNNVTLLDCQNCSINRPYINAQDRLLWRDKTCPERT